MGVNRVGYAIRLNRNSDEQGFTTERTAKMNIPGIYRNNNEDYITMPAIKRFINNNGISYKSSELREKLFEKILDFGEESDLNAEKVLDWIDEVV